MKNNFLYRNWPTVKVSRDIPVDENGHQFRNPEYDTIKHEKLHAKPNLRHNQTLSHGHDSIVVPRRSDRLRDRIGITKDKARIDNNPSLRSFDIQVVGSTAFLKSIKNSKTPVNIICLLEIDNLTTELQPENVKKQLPFDDAELQRKVLHKFPPEYQNLLKSFSKSDSDQLPKHRYIDHHINLNDEAKLDDLGYSPLYKMSLEELQACREYITESLKKDFIESSSAPWAALVLLVPKKNGGLRF